MLDFKFCDGRLSSAPGLLVNNINGSGNGSFGWTTTPQVQLTDFQATANVSIGQLIVMGSDYRWRALVGPASLGLFMQTDATGNVIFGNPPAATVPDPLNINNLNVAVKTTTVDLTTTGAVTLNNVTSGTVANLLGLDATNVLVTQAVSAGVAGSMFYEASTSPSATSPNQPKINGQYLVIGNRLFDSGGNLIGVTTSEALTVNVAGKYLLGWMALCRSLTNAKVSVDLEINGVVVNNGNGRNDAAVPNCAALQFVPLTGFEVRTLAVNDVLKLQLSASGTMQTFNARMVALKFADL